MHETDFCDVVRPRTISDKRKTQIESILAESSRLVSLYRSSSSAASKTEFYSEFLRNYRPGNGVQLFGVFVPEADARAMYRIKEFEGELLAGFAKMISMLVRRASRKSGRDPEDFIGEAFVAFFAALTNYNGTKNFSTYLHLCVQRHLSRSCLKQEEIKTPVEIRKVKMRVVGRMNREGVSFDEALKSEGVSGRKVAKVVASMSKVCCATELDVRESEIASTTDPEPVPGVMKAVEHANLGYLEKAVLKSFMEAPTGSMGLTKGCAGMVNPETGRPYSSAALSAAWKRAREKIACALKEVA